MFLIFLRIFTLFKFEQQQQASDNKCSDVSDMTASGNAATEEDTSGSTRRSAVAAGKGSIKL